ncbi:ABC transporter ATP-binding protein [Corynebacterium sp. Marseille-Q2516]
MIRARDLAVAGILTDINLDVPPTSTVALVGPNGSGKTTLLRTLAGTRRPTSGTVHIDGTDLADLRGRDLGRAIAVVAQEHDADIPLTVAELVLLGRLPHRGFQARPTAADQDIAAHYLDALGLLPLARRPWSRLSGGERQRALIARGLTQQASYLLLAEPTNPLDVRYQFDALDAVARRDGGAVVVLHDLTLAARYCDTATVLNAGGIVAQGPPDAVFTPEILEPVYRTRVTRIEHAGRPTLLFDSAT